MTCIRRPHTVWTTCPCEDCAASRRRMAKVHRTGRYNRVPPEVALAVLQKLRDHGWTDHAIASATGLHHRSVNRALDGARIGPTNAAKIMRYTDPTAGSVGPTGTRRRLQGLARQGYDLATISAGTGIGYSTLAAIRNGQTETAVRSAFYTTIRDYTEQVGMTIGPSRLAAQHAERHNWPGLLAWDDVDDRHEHAGRQRNDRGGVDEATVLRVLAGERMRTTRAEKAEIMRRWVESGRSAASLAERLGWKQERYSRGAA